MARKGVGKEAKLSYSGNLLVENRNGLIVNARVWEATGTAERDAALMMLEQIPGPHVCPLAKVIWPLLEMESPVSAGAAPPVPNSRFRLAEGLALLLLTGSVCQRKSWFTALFVPLLKAEATASRG